MPWSSWHMLAQDSGDLPAGKVGITYMGMIGSIRGQDHHPQPPGGPHSDLYPSTNRLCMVLLNSFLPISSCTLSVSRFIVAFRYDTAKRNMSKLVCCKLIWMDWPPWWSKHSGTCAQPHPGNVLQRSLNDYGLSISGKLEGDRMHLVWKLILAACLDNWESYTLHTPLWKSA